MKAGLGRDQSAVAEFNLDGLMMAHLLNRNLSEAGTMFNDSNDLRRFITAQEPVFSDVLSELRRGQKRTHWMWFVFPQITGLGKSGTARLYSIKSRSEAVAYLRHSVLGQRLEECTRILSSIEGRSAEQIFGAIDALKLRSSMTLFAEVADDATPFREVLEKYYDGKPDQVTLDILQKL